MTDNALFTLATFGIELTPTAAMRQGTQKVAQCPWCGTVVVWQKTGDRLLLGTCPLPGYRPLIRTVAKEHTHDRLE